MAVQAQYPSSVLLVNRSGQDGLDYSLQPQAGRGGDGGLVVDQSFMSLNNGGSSNNPRKRSRELLAAANTNTNMATTTSQINPFPMQTQSPQLINLFQLHHPNVVSTGLRLSFGDQQPLHQQTHQCQSPFSSSLLSDDLAPQIKRQRDELDQFLLAQGKQLRRALAEKTQRHYRALLGAADESITRRLREKDAEVEKARRRNVELEARAAQLSVEAQVWQAKARAQDATAASLQAQLQQAIINCGGAGGGKAQDSRRGDGGLMCTGEVAEDAESAYVDPERVISVGVSWGPTCKRCQKRVALVVLLPCRHLCVCPECDRAVQACPLCFNMRDSSVEVFLS